MSTETVIVVGASRIGRAAALAIASELLLAHPGARVVTEEDAADLLAQARKHTLMDHYDPPAKAEWYDPHGSGKKKAQWKNEVPRHRRGR